LGCALSHIAIYRLVKERNLSHALILEDDAWLNPNLPQLLKAIAEKYPQEKRRVLLLTSCGAISLRKWEFLWSSYQINKVKSAACTHGYVVTNAAADVLIEALYPVRHVADCWTL
jgi:glycosyl transferase family 25